MKQIPLSQGLFALVDDSDYDFLMQWKWCALKERNTFTAMRKHKKIHIYMHRQILGIIDPKIFVDHLDTNGLNNQRSNLRPCTNAQNLMNRGPNKNNTSGFKGVSWDCQRGKWTSKIMIDRKTVHLGRYCTKEEAALAYNEGAKIHHGEFAKLNEL